MKRRGVLGLLGGALAAGPSMAKEAVSSIGSMQVPGAIEGAMNIGGQIGNYDAYPSNTAYDHTDWLKDRLLELTGMDAEARRERMEGTWVQSLDPDLAVNRSFSLSTKVQIQKRRNFEKQLESEKRSITRQIADFMKQPH
jgi:hypothetical protein